jgi:hypothetical protein
MATTGDLNLAVDTASPWNCSAPAPFQLSLVRLLEDYWDSIHVR